MILDHGSELDYYFILNLTKDVGEKDKSPEKTDNFCKPRIDYTKNVVKKNSVPRDS